jgi:hypothetical protein
MSGLLDSVLGQLDGGRMSQLAAAIGADDASTEKAVASALPALVGGLAANASDPRGAAALDAALDAHDESVFDRFGELVDGAGPGRGIVTHVLGDKQEGVANALAGSSGLSLDAISKLLPMLAPLVMGVLGQQKKSGSIDIGGLAGMLGGEAKKAEGGMPDLGSIFSMLGGTAPAKKGGLGGLLGKLLGRK